MKNNKNEELRKTNINWYPGHMVKTKRQIMEDLKLVDVIIELLDSRIPIASQNPDIAELIGNKKRIILLNKSDLAEEEETKKWIAYFKGKGINAVATESNTGVGVQNCLKLIEQLMQEELKKQAEKGRIHKTIRVMILGIPNVGKSSFINRIAKKNSAEVGNKPGVTKRKQWVRVGKKIDLLDTPGVLWPKFESEMVALNLSYTGSIKDTILQQTEIAYELLKYLYKQYPENLWIRYQINEDEKQKIKEKEQQNEEILELMNVIAKKRGTILSGGKIDEEKLARLVLDDFRSGRLGRITLEKVEESWK